MLFFKTILSLLNKKDKVKSIIYCFYSLINSALELLILTAVLPLTQLVSKSNPQNIFSEFFINFDYSQQVYFAVALLALLYLIKNSFFTYFTFWLYNFFSGVEKRYSVTLFNSYLHRKYQFFKKNNSSFLINKITESGAVGSVLKGMCTIITELLVVLFLVVFLILKEPLATILILLFFSFIVITAAIFFKKKIRFWGQQQLYYNAIIKNYLIQYFEGIKDVKIFSKENIIMKDFNEVQIKAVDFKVTFEIFSQMPRIVFETVSVISFCLLIYLLVFFDSDAKLIEITAIFLAATFRLMPSVSRIAASYSTVQNNYALITQIEEDLRNNKKIEIRENNISFNKNIEIIGLNFKFKDSEKKLLEKINLNIKKGQTIGILGESGSGKTTFVDILSGLIDEYEGKILIDGILLNHNNINSWQNKIGYIQQSVFLLDDSIKNNITWKDEKSYNEERFIKSIKDSNLNKFIDTLPLGYETSIGERGSKISGGQRQRLSIARSLYKNSEIFIWDEATSALDMENETQIYDLIYDKLKDKTNIIITHKEKLLDKCDKVYFLNKNGNFLLKEE